MKTTAVTMDIVAEFDQFVISSSTDTDTPPELMEELHEDVDTVVRRFGFTRTRSVPDQVPSRRNGGWAYYDTYVFRASDNNIRLGINVRTANHPSKPNLDAKNKKRLKLLREELEESENLELLDTYYSERNWGAQYYIGRGSRYSDPVDSLDQFNRILEGQLTKLIQQYGKE